MKGASGRSAATAGAIRGADRIQSKHDREAGRDLGPVIEYSYRKDRGQYVTIALTNGTSIDISARQIAEMIRLSAQPAKRKK